MKPHKNNWSNTQLDHKVKLFVSEVSCFSKLIQLQFFNFSYRMAAPVRYLEFSPDDHYFASAGMVSLYIHESLYSQVFIFVNLPIFAYLPVK